MKLNQFQATGAQRVVPQVAFREAPRGRLIVLFILRMSSGAWVRAYLTNESSADIIGADRDPWNRAAKHAIAKDRTGL
jgi:hypothetical protein